MAVYDPLRPQVIGAEWSPVRQEAIPFDLGTEIGYTLAVTGTAGGTLNEPDKAAFALGHIPTTLVQGQTPFVSIYRRGQEANVGPIYRMTIPVDSVSITGAALVGAVTGAEALANEYDDKYVRLSSGSSQVLAFFSLTSSGQIAAIQNRRILKANLLYTASGPFTEFDNDTIGVFAALQSSTAVWGFGLGSVSGPLSATDNVSISRVNLGDVNPFWSAGTNPFTEPSRFPWRWEELNRMNSTEPVATRFGLAIRGQNLPTTVTPVDIGYMALELVVCEENRIRYGGAAMGYSVANPLAFQGFNKDINIIDLRTTSFQTTGALDPGDYSVTLTLADSGDSYNRGDKARFSSLRQADNLADPGPQGVLITKWQDPDGLREVAEPGAIKSQYFSPGNVPIVEDYNILPGIAVFRTNVGLPLNSSAPHNYHIQVAAPVRDTVTVRQGIINDAGGAQVSFPWVRYYARRFGNLSRTLKLQSVSNPSLYVTIDQDTFDELPEIIDGWREVTLRFETATPSFSNTGIASLWEWSHINGSVTVENQWEILGAYTRSLQGSSTTYGGGTVQGRYNDSFLHPVNTVGDVQFSDIILMFSQDPIAVSGLAIETLSQEVTGIGLECATLPECVPTGIGYHHVTWDAGNIVCDTFSRSVTGEWDGTDTGQTYTTVGGSASDYEVSDGVGTLTVASGTGSRRTVLSGMTQTDPDLYTQFSINQTPVGASLTLGFTARGTDSSNQYVLSARCNADGTITALIERVIAGSFVNIGSATVPNVTFFAGQTYNMRARLEGTSLRLRIWEQNTVEPTIWHATATDATYTTGTVSGFRANVAAGYTGAYPVVFSVDNFMTSEITVVGSTYELQRSDDVDTDWQTIMVSSDLCPVDFNDYEARVGVASHYRIRLVNALRFPGPWSDTVSSTLTEPGVFGVGDGNSVLIFTTNEVQSGARNLAYSMSWERNPEEEFSFPEAETVQLQSLFQRDFVVAFRPTERGGEQFSRTLLINNAAVPTERMRDGFRSLRDMAWEDVSYICVRNELGDRWFATVLVPGGSIQRNRRLYLAQVDIVEVTSTPSTVTIPAFGEE